MMPPDSNILGLEVKLLKLTLGVEPGQRRAI